MAGYEGLDPDFQSKLMNLIAASGGRLTITSGYRSNDEQQALWDEAVAKYGPDGARQWVAPPGLSNHNAGMAADLSGDLAWAHENAGAFGLYFPMDWENWHIEPIGTRGTNTSPANVQPPSPAREGYANPRTQPSTPSDPAMVLAGMLGINTGLDAFTNSHMPSAQFAIPMSSIPQLGTVTPPPPPTTPATSASEIDRFMSAIRARESRGDYAAVGQIPTPWGRASGAYQFLDGTWNNYGGYARAADAPPSVQDERARSLMLSYYQQFGNWSDVAGAWFAGPGGDFTTGEVREYTSDVLGRMG